uniref:Uncharacterized protein n=1 Tax=Alectorobius mimon TaxID=360319 RepID=A0A147B7G1_9ACAR
MTLRTAVLPRNHLGFKVQACKNRSPRQQRIRHIWCTPEPLWNSCNDDYVPTPSECRVSTRSAKSLRKSGGLLRKTRATVRKSWDAISCPDGFNRGIPAGFLYARRNYGASWT